MYYTISGSKSKSTVDIVSICTHKALTRLRMSADGKKAPVCRTNRPSTAAALVFNLGLNLILIPIYQQTGAALVTTLTELLLLCISFTFVPQGLLSKEIWKVGSKTLIASLFMASVIFLFFRSV